MIVKQLCLSLFEYDYEIHRQCVHGGYDGDCKDYCRCGKITGHFTSVRLNDLFEHVQIWFKPRKKWSEIELYCLGRLMISHRLYDVDAYDFNVRRGYYGDELEDATWCSSSYLPWLEDVTQCLSLKSDSDKIKFVLNKEYGYLLSDMENATFEIRKVKDADVLKPIDYRRCDGESSDFGCAVAVCKVVCRDGAHDQYRIVDGHHRWRNNTKNQYKIIVY